MPAVNSAGSVHSINAHRNAASLYSKWQTVLSLRPGLDYAAYILFWIVPYQSAAKPDDILALNQNAIKRHTFDNVHVIYANVNDQKRSTSANVFSHKTLDSYVVYNEMRWSWTSKKWLQSITIILRSAHRHNLSKKTNPYISIVKPSIHNGRPTARNGKLK